MWLSLVHAHNLLQSLIACHICWTVEKTFSSLIACNARLADAVAGMQINSINFRLHELLEQLCRCFDLSTTIWAFMKFQVFNDSYPEPRFCIRSCLRTFKTNLGSLNVQTWPTETFSAIFPIGDCVWHLTCRRFGAPVAESQMTETGTSRKQVVYEKIDCRNVSPRFLRKSMREFVGSAILRLWRFLVKKNCKIIYQWQSELWASGVTLCKWQNL